MWCPSPSWRKVGFHTVSIEISTLFRMIQMLAEEHTPRYTGTTPNDLVKKKIDLKSLNVKTKCNDDCDKNVSLGKIYLNGWEKST